MVDTSISGLTGSTRPPTPFGFYEESPFHYVELETEPTPFDFAADNNFVAGTWRWKGEHEGYLQKGFIPFTFGYPLLCRLRSCSGKLN